MLLDILVWGLVAISLLWPVFAAMAIGNVYDSLTTKPKAPTPSPTPEELAKFAADYRKFEAMRNAAKA